MWNLQGVTLTLEKFLMITIPGTFFSVCFLTDRSCHLLFFSDSLIQEPFQSLVICSICRWSFRAPVRSEYEDCIRAVGNCLFVACNILGCQYRHSWALDRYKSISYLWWYSGLFHSELSVVSSKIPY